MWKKWKELAGSHRTSSWPCCLLFLSHTYWKHTPHLRKDANEPKLTWTLLSSLPRRLRSCNLNSCTGWWETRSPLTYSHTCPSSSLTRCVKEEKTEKKGGGGWKLILRLLRFTFLPSQGNTGQEAQESPLIQIRCSLLDLTDRTGKVERYRTGTFRSTNLSTLRAQLFLQIICAAVLTCLAVIGVQHYMRYLWNVELS